jgi:hypothetical protein
MMERCHNRSNKDYPDYGGRGIRVCERWRAFAAFFADMGVRPSLAHSIDRYPNNDGNYEPGNCRWATSKEQARNKRNNRILRHGGRAATIAEWAEITGLPGGTIQARVTQLRWSVADALSRPLHERRVV